MESSRHIKSTASSLNSSAQENIRKILNGDVSGMKSAIESITDFVPLPLEQLGLTELTGPDAKRIDKLTNVDNILRLILGQSVRQSISNETIIKLLSTIARLTEANVLVLESFASALTGREIGEDLTVAEVRITYPATGGKKSLEVSDYWYEFDFLEGVVNHRSFSKPDDMSNSLLANDRGAIRSYKIHTDAEVLIKFDKSDFGIYTLEADQSIGEGHYGFQKIYIKVSTVASNIKILASTNASAVWDEGKPITQIAESRKVVETTASSNFISELVQYASEIETLIIPKKQINISSVYLTSEQRLSYRAHIWGTLAGSNANPDTESYFGTINFSSASAVQCKDTGLWRYNVPTDINFINPANAELMYVELENIDTTTKTAGTGGRVLMKFNVSPRFG